MDYTNNQKNILLQLKKIRDKLIKEQKELDPEIKELLYSNLWDLYE